MQIHAGLIIICFECHRQHTIKHHLNVRVFIITVSLGNGPLLNQWMTSINRSNPNGWYISPSKLFDVELKSIFSFTSIFNFMHVPTNSNSINSASINQKNNAIFEWSIQHLIWFTFDKHKWWFSVAWVKYNYKYRTVRFTLNLRKINTI